jgi:hypothetical protein
MSIRDFTVYRDADALEQLDRALFHLTAARDRLGLMLGDA